MSLDFSFFTWPPALRLPVSPKDLTGYLVFFFIPLHRVPFGSLTFFLFPGSTYLPSQFLFPHGMNATKPSLKTEEWGPIVYSPPSQQEVFPRLPFFVIFSFFWFCLPPFLQCICFRIGNCLFRKIPSDGGNIKDVPPPPYHSCFSFLRLAPHFSILSSIPNCFPVDKHYRP